MSGRKKSLEDGLDRYFELYAPTLALALELIASKRHSQELVLLLCARLDAMASDAAREGTPSKQAFVKFLNAYSGQRRLFEGVSVPDLY